MGSQGVAPASDPLVTVMIPTYRQAALVGRAIDSALAQDYRALEVVVSDDASPDQTTQAVERYRDPRLRYHRSERNRGRVANYRHALYELARGEWVVNLDGDDCLHLGCVYRRHVALPLAFYRSEAVGSDWESLYRLACHGKVVVLAREVGQ